MDENKIQEDITETVSKSPALSNEAAIIINEAAKTDAGQKTISEMAAKNTADIVAATRYSVGGQSSAEALDAYKQSLRDAWDRAHQRTIPDDDQIYPEQPTKYINTTGLRTTEGLQNVVQYESDVSMPGLTPVGGGYGGTGIQSAGQGAPVPGSDLNEMTGNAVNDFFWKNAGPKVYTKVDPFEVHSDFIPDFKIMTDTTDPKKTAFKVAYEKFGGTPIDFFGYDRIALSSGPSSTALATKPTPWIRAIGGGLIDAGAMPIRFALNGANVTAQAMQAFANSIGGGEYLRPATDYISRFTETAMVPATQLNESDSTFKKIVNQAPNLLTQLGLLAVGGTAGMAAIIGTGVADATSRNLIATKDMPMSTEERFGRAGLSGLATGMLDYVGFKLMMPFLGRGATNLLTKKGITRRVAGDTVLGVAVQPVLNKAQLNLDYALRDALTLENKTLYDEQLHMANVMAFIGQAAGSGINYLKLHSVWNQQQQTLNGLLLPLLKTQKDAIATIKRIYNVDDTEAKRIYGLLKTGFKNGEYSEELKNILDGAIDRFDNENLKTFLDQFGDVTPEQAKEVGRYLRTQFAKDVMPKIGEGFSDSERMAIVGLMKGIASIMTYAGVDPRSVAGEMFSVKRAKPGEGSSYVPKERTVYVAQDVGSIGLEIGMLTDTAAKSNLTPQSRSLLHEIGHGLDHMLSRADAELNGKPENTEPGLFAEWMPKYFDAIKTAFGPKVSEKVEALATNDRVGSSSALTKKMGKLARKRGANKDVQLADTPEATSEYFAYALSHLTREQLFDLLGLTGAPAEVMDALVAMSTSDIVIPEMQKQLNAYKQSLVNTMKQNKTLIDQVLKEYNGDTSELKAAVEKFVAGDTDALSLDNLQKLADIVESFIDGETAEIVGEVFENISIKTFSEQAREEINAGLEEASPEQNEIVEDLNRRLRDGGEVSVADAESPNPKSAPKVIDKDLQKTLDDMEPTKESGKDIFDLSEKDEASDETLHEVSRDPDAALLASLYAKLDGKRVDTTLAHKLEDKLDGKTLIESQDDVIDAIYNAPKGSKLYTGFTLGKYTGSVMDVLHAVNPALEKMFPVGRVSSARNQISNEHMRGWEAKAKEIVGGDNEYRKWTIDSQLKRYKTTKNLIGGKTVEVELSKQQLMSAYELLNQSDADSNARIVKSYPEIKSLIDKNLTTQDKAVADMTQQHLQGIFDRIKDILSDEDNIDLGKIENYFPIYDVIKTDTGTRINSAKARSVTNSRYAGGIEAQPIFEVLQRYVEWAANVESGYTRTLRRMKDVFNYKSDGMYKGQKYADLDAQAENNAFNIRQALRERYGENMVEKINSEVSDLLDQHPVYTPTGAFSSATNTLVSNAISWNILSLPKNLLSNMFIAMTEPGAFASFLKGLMAPRATYEDMIRYRAIADRLEGVDIDDLFNTATRSQGILGYVMNNTKLGSFLAGKGYEKPVTALMAYSSLFKKLGQKTFMQFGDALGLVYGLKPTVDKMRAQGFNDAQINAELTRKIQEFTSTADKATEPKAIRDIKHTGVGPMLAFKKDLAIKSAKIARDLVDAYRGDSVAKQAAARDIAAIILSIGVFSAISAGVWDLWSDDEDVRKDAETAVKREVLSTMLGYNPMVSAMGEPVAEYALGFGGTSGYSSPILSFGNNYIKDLKKDRKFNIAIDTATLVAGMPGLPKAASESQGLVGAIFGDYVDERERDYYTSMALGRTENYASKRSGYDPKQVDKTDEND